MVKTLPPEPDVTDDAATAKTLVDIMRRQRERDRRLLRLATTVAITAFILAITATLVAWSQYAGWPASPRRPVARNEVRPPTSIAPVTPESSPAPESLPPRPEPPPSSSSLPSEPVVPPSTSTPSTAVAPNMAPSSSPSVPTRPSPAETTTPPASDAARRAIAARPPSASDEPVALTPDRPSTRAPRPSHDAETPPTAAPKAPAFGDVNVRVATRTDSRGELRDYVVTLKDSGGAAFSGADVRLQGRMADRRLVEVVLDPSALPGEYRAEVRMGADGPADLRLRITVRGTTVVVPINTLSGS